MVIGAPIHLPTLDSAGKPISEHKESWLSRDEEGIRRGDAAHAEYLQAVKDLYEQHKSHYFLSKVKSMSVDE